MNQSIDMMQENKVKVAVVITVLLFLVSLFIGGQLAIITSGISLEVFHDPEKQHGCCYDVGLGYQMAECCHKPHLIAGGDGTMSKNNCPVENIIGGATKFEEGVTCPEFKNFGWN